jgi:hypothetical protein
MARSGALQLLHYWWPVALGLSLAIVVQRATGRAIDPPGLALLLCGVTAAYSFDRVFDPSAGPSPAWVLTSLRVAGWTATAAGLLLAVELPIRTMAAMPVFGLAAAGHARLKRIALAKTLIVPAVWTWAVIALPFPGGSWFGWRWIQTPVALPIFLLMASGCMLCDLKDADRDRRASVQSVPARWGVPAASTVAILLAAAATLAAALHSRPGLAFDGVCLAAAATWPGLLARDEAGPLLVDVILTLPGILILARLV